MGFPERMVRHLSGEKIGSEVVLFCQRYGLVFHSKRVSVDGESDEEFLVLGVHVVPETEREMIDDGILNLLKFQKKTSRV